MFNKKIFKWAEKQGYNLDSFKQYMNYRKEKFYYGYANECNGYFDDYFMYNCLMKSCLASNYLLTESSRIKNDSDSYQKFCLLKDIEMYNDDYKDKKIAKVIDFYTLTNTLKHTIRSGWKHWNVSSDRLESVAEHVYGTCMLAIALDSEFDFNIDTDKVIKMLAIHELEETKIGDITEFDSESDKLKKIDSHTKVKEVLNGLIKEDEYFSLIKEFDDRNTNEAKFAYMCDKLECDIQAKLYEEKGYNSLDNQDNNPALRNEVIKEIINSGVKTVADVFIQYDKPKYQNNEVFSRTLKYVEKNNIN